MCQSSIFLCHSHLFLNYSIHHKHDICNLNVITLVEVHSADTGGFLVRVGFCLGFGFWVFLFGFVGVFYNAKYIKMSNN